MKYLVLVLTLFATAASAQSLRPAPTDDNVVFTRPVDDFRRQPIGVPTEGSETVCGGSFTVHYVDLKLSVNQAWHRGDLILDCATGELVKRLHGNREVQARLRS